MRNSILYQRFYKKTGYQILVIVRGTAMGLDPSCRKVFRSLAGTAGGAGRGMLLQTLRHVYVPAALPGLFTSLKVAVGTAVAVLFLAESFATRSGLGFRILDAWGRGDAPEMFVGILGMSLLGLALYALCCLGERAFCPWRNA